MSLTRFPHGVSSFGMPMLGPLGINMPSRGGRVVFVDGVNGGPGSDGLTQETAVSTITAGIARAQAGDTIIVYPATYAENVVLNKDYITLIGAQQGYGKPDVVPATGMALHVDNAQGVVVARMRFASAGALVAASATAGRLVRIEGNGFHVEDCVFDGTAGDNASSVLVGLKGDSTITSYTASEGRIMRCLFRGAQGRGLAFEGAEPTVGVGSTHCEILRNRFMDNVGIDIISLDAFGGAATYSVQDALIAENWFMSAKNKATWIDFTTSNGGAAADNDGMIAGNIFADDALDTTAVAMVGTGFTFVANYDTVGVQDGSAFD